MKPRILVFIDSEFQKKYFTSLSQDYNFIFKKLRMDQPVDTLVEETLHELDSSGERIDGVLGASEEVSIPASLVAQKRGLCGAKPESLYKAQNKAVFLALAAQLNAPFPETIIVSSMADIPGNFSYPAFIKPAKGAMSESAYTIESEEHLRKILPPLLQTRTRYSHWSQSFFDAFKKPSDPPITAFILQPFIHARQYTVDGFVFEGSVTLLGVTESIFTPNGKSFLRFDFPAQLSEKAHSELDTVVKAMITKIGYNNSNFNIEFFVTEQDHIILIEFNTRLAIQFVPLMLQWYQISNLEITISIALGKKPVVKERAHKRAASSCVLRVLEDSYVEKVPDQDTISTLIALDYALAIHILVEEGKKLSDYRQDSYSFRYCLIDIAGRDRGEILTKLEYVKSHLNFVLRPLPISV